MQNSGVTKPLNIIIALPESDFFKEFVSYIISHHTIKNLGFAEKLKEAFPMAVELDSDLVIIDDSFIEVDCRQLKNEIERAEYNGTTIVFAGSDIYKCKDIGKYENVFFVDKTLNKEEVIKHINLVIQHGMTDVETKSKISIFDHAEFPIEMYRQATKLLVNCGFNPKHKGFLYLRDASIMTLLEIRGGSLSKDIYPVIANRYNVSDESVERAIRHAVSKVWQTNRLEPLSKFGIKYRFDDRPTNSVIISCFTDILRELNG
jgi:DNA-binding NarL/FixJ family response regulator